MNKYFLFLLIGLLIATHAHSMDEETKNKMIYVYNLTRNTYINVFLLLDDYESGAIEPGFAEQKLLSWKTQYNEETDLVPRELDKLRELTNQVINTIQKIIHEDRPKSHKTKDWKKELDIQKTELVNEIKQIRYSLN